MVGEVKAKFLKIQLCPNQGACWSMTDKIYQNKNSFSIQGQQKKPVGRLAGCNTIPLVPPACLSISYSCASS